MAFKLTNPTHKKGKSSRVNYSSKTIIQELEALEELSIGFTNFTPIKKKHSKGKLSSQTIIQELEALESLSVEELLRSVQTLEESLQDLPSLEDHIAEVERLTEQMEKELEEYLNES